ncbi:MAG: carbon-nitrogen hydrolase family protein [Magnetococcales bacterium]|nr:carbon-nitrogen hydrolase family protein [Magnetococcales bacterium]
MSQAALIQMCTGPDRDANLLEAERLMTLAIERGATLIVLPECFSFMGRTEAEKIAGQEDPDDSPSLQFLQEFAAKRGVWVVGGSISLSLPGNSRFANSCCVVDASGDLQARYDKIHLFDAQIGERQPYRESNLIQAGNRPVVVDTPFGRMGLSICYDLRFPELYRQLVAMGATLLTVPSAFTVSTGQAHWELLLRARAVENFSYVLAAGQEGKHPGGRRTYGQSLIVEPWGTVVGRCADGAGIVLAEIDQDRVVKARQKIPCLGYLPNLPL